MTEQERQKVLDTMPINYYVDERGFTMPTNIAGVFQWYSFNRETIRAALQSPRVPMIPGLDEAIKETEYKYFGDYEMSKEQRDAVDKLVEIARAYAELQKGK